MSRSRAIARRRDHQRSARRPAGLSAASRTESVALSYTDTALWGGNLVSQIFFNRTRDTFGAEVNPIATFQDATIAPVGTLVDQSQNRSRKIGGKISYERAVPGFEALTGTLGFDVLTDTTEQRLIATEPRLGAAQRLPQPRAVRAAQPRIVRQEIAAGRRRPLRECEDQDRRLSTRSPRPRRRRAAWRFRAARRCSRIALVNGGVIVEPVPGIRAYASYAEGYTVPDIGRITRAVNRPNVDIDDFLDIAPIVSNNREIGVEVKNGPFDGSVTYFWSSSDKGQLLIANPGGIFDVQRLRVEIQGVEINLGVKLPIDGLRVNVGYAHLDGRYDSNTVPDGKTDTDLDGTNISPDRLNLAADYASGPFTARVQTQFFLSRSFKGRNRDPRNDFGGYTLTDAYLRYQTGLGGLTFSVSNLFDEQYIDYSSDTRLPTDNLSYFAGRGRAFTLGWDFRF
jgi:iron complex outermembrane receptor protein